MPHVWFADCEVFAHDLIWVFQSKRTGEVKVFHNDCGGVAAFLATSPDLWLCGYNFRDYDQYILKGTLMGFSNEMLKTLNDLLIFGEDRTVAWNYLGPDAWDVNMPPIIDLFHDIVPPKSLKEIEGNLGLDVVETGVSFDIERPLTPEELQMEIDYCKYDVYATSELYKHRTTYLKTKQTLCKMADLDESKMMMHTNARVVSEALRADKDFDPLLVYGTEKYIEDGFIPECIDFERMPEAVKELVLSIDTYSGWQNKLESIQFDCHGTPTVMGIGGIHACTGVFVEKTFKSGPRKGETIRQIKTVPTVFYTDDDYEILIQDIGSFYPSMMILFNFISRAIPYEHRHLFTDLYDIRMRAKHDKSLAQFAAAAKLVLNTVYGCMKNQYNKLYDPFMATCVCITGQLFVLDLMNRISDAVDDFEIVQLNTDGWVLRIRKSERAKLDAVVEKWCKDTGFTVDTDVIKTLFQRDVNNYVMEFDTGKVKAKGGTVGNWEGGTFKSNSATIIDEALVRKMLYDVEISDTIYACKDLERFQLILKAGGTYKKCCKSRYGGDFVPIDGKVHRVYAVKEGWSFFKQKEDGGNPSRFPDSPENALEGDFVKTAAAVDKNWYIELATKKYNEFIGRED